MARIQLNVDDNEFKAKVVQHILANDAGRALELLAEHYDTITPRLEVGLPKGHAGAVGCYEPRKRTIYTRDSDGLSNPFLIIHEFYHHIRTVDGKQMGTEKLADKFAWSFLDAYRRQTASSAST